MDTGYVTNTVIVLPAHTRTILSVVLYCCCTYRVRRDLLIDIELSLVAHKDAQQCKAFGRLACSYIPQLHPVVRA